MFVSQEESLCVGNRQVLHGWREKRERIPICLFHGEIRGPVLHRCGMPPCTGKLLMGRKTCLPLLKIHFGIPFSEACDSLPVHTDFSNFKFFFHYLNRYLKKNFLKMTHVNATDAP